MQPSPPLPSLTLTHSSSSSSSSFSVQVVEKATKLAQLPANQFQNAYSHCINKVHEVGQ
jgi:hypothetical protein